jgi:hypothetical protein
VGIEPTSETEQAPAISGSTIRNTAAMHLMAIAEQPANSAGVDPVAPGVRAVSGDLAVQVAQAVLVVSAGRVVLVGLANQVVQAASVVSENPVAQGALGNRVAPVVPAALDQQHVPEAAVLGLVLEAERRPGPAEVVLIRSVIAAYLPVQVPAVAASAVAAETLLAPAAAAVALA